MSLKALYDFLVEFSGAAFGVLAGFQLDRYWEKRKSSKRINDLIPIIIEELEENLRLDKSYRNAPTLFHEEEKRFRHVYLDLYKEELSKLSVDIGGNFPKVYETIIAMNRYLKYANESPPGRAKRFREITNKKIDDMTALIEKEVRVLKECSRTQIL
jgi:hypothetical protein